MLCLFILPFLGLVCADLPFTIPFAVEPYTGHLEAISDDRQSGAVVYWRTTADEVFVGLAAAGLWAGFGMNEKSPSMQGADIVICREHDASSGIVTAADYIATQLGAPELDVVQDWATLRSGRVHYTPPDPPEGACKEGWTFAFNKCLKVGGPATQATAKSNCASEGGTLVNIRDEAENKYVVQLALGSPEAERAFVWVGAERANPNAAWQAPDGSTPYTNWHGGAPTSGTYDNCAVLGTTKTQETHWKKADEKWWAPDCRWNEPRYVCERPVEEGTPHVDPTLYEPRLPVTWCEIRRSRLTCDPSEDYQIKELDISIRGLLAWPPPSQGNDLLQYHGSGQRRQQLFSFSGSALGSNSLPSDATEVVFSPPDHMVSAASGSFAYSYHKFDIDESKKYHVIQWRNSWNRHSPAAQAGLQHHLDLRACSGPIPGATVDGVITAGQAMEYCGNNFLVASRTLPSDEGIPIGAGGPIYLAIERHYYNPAGKSGLADTGAKFYVTYTSQLRPKEMSSLHIGTLALKVPPKHLGFVMRSHCPPACTSKMGRTTATLISFHAHGHTRAAYLRLIRDGVELEPLAHIEPYDDSIATRSINREIIPGDELLLDCVYDNDLDKEIVYGDGIDDEMCWATLSLVGQNPVSKCYDYPDVANNKWPTYDTDCAWCVSNQQYTGGCAPCNVADPFARCPGAGEDMGTGRIDDAFDRRGDPNAGNTISYLKYEPYSVQIPSCDAQLGTPEVVPAIPGRCPANGDKITGSKECKFKWGGSMRVSWETDCVAQTVKFDLERAGSVGWMALGLHSAGTAASPLALTPTRMNGADIVQVSASTGAFKDALGEDYKTPRAKNTAVAQLVTSEVSGNKQRASFTRPFASAEGTTLVEDGFVWLMCAYRSSSNDLDAKHQQAVALSRSRISLFGGVAESTRYVKKAPTPSPTPLPPGATFAPTAAPTPLPPTAAPTWRPTATEESSGLTVSAAAAKRINGSASNAKERIYGNMGFVAGMLAALTASGRLT